MTANEAVPSITRRRRRLAALLAGPAVVVALVLCGIEGWRAFQPQWQLRATRFTYTLADAIAIGDLQQTSQFIRAGKDPNALIAVRHPVFTGGRGVAVPPILWAITMQNTQAVQMLLGFGAHMTPATARLAMCLADALRNKDIVRVLSAHGGPQSSQPCATGQAGEPPLLRVLAGAE